MPLVTYTCGTCGKKFGGKDMDSHTHERDKAEAMHCELTHVYVDDIAVVGVKHSYNDGTCHGFPYHVILEVHDKPGRTATYMFQYSIDNTQEDKE